ncbi:MAG TPA: T9SS type A sorting domain-containing protein, partial [Candidatus Cloacimonadota bacterium]|nr:T9SS type A sorting domain-containing protein [Candidatus Cloacimonadota bacterium]
RDYQAKAYIQLEEYQSAADLIELYLEDPESEVDSLNAVLDLEICYLLSSLSQSKKPLITEYSQYKYPDIPTYQTNHRKHLQQLLELMNKSDNQSAPVSVLSLGHNYPNPFNPSTTIEYSVPMTAKVKLRIYNIRGQLVKELVNQTVEPGRYKAVWEGKNNAGHSVASGVYFYRIEANGKTITKKMLMLK